MGRDWTKGAGTVIAPCDAPYLVLTTVSEGLENGPWLLCIDDVSLTPEAKQARQ